MFPKRERQYQQHFQEGLSADLGPDHLDITHLDRGICMPSKASPADWVSLQLRDLFASVSTLWTSGR